MSASQSSSSTGLPVSRRPATMPRRRTSLFSGEIPGRRAYMQRRASWATLSIQSSCVASSAQVSSTRTVSIYGICLGSQSAGRMADIGGQLRALQQRQHHYIETSRRPWATRSGVRASGAASTPNAHLGNAFARLAASGRVALSGIEHPDKAALFPRRLLPAPGGPGRRSGRP